VFECYNPEFRSIKSRSELLFVLVPDCNENSIKSWGFKHTKLERISKIRRRVKKINYLCIIFFRNIYCRLNQR